MNIQLTEEQIAKLDQELAGLKELSPQTLGEPAAAEVLPEFEALAKEIAAKYGLTHIRGQVKEIVATYDFINQVVDDENVPIVFSVAIEKAFKF